MKASTLLTLFLFAFLSQQTQAFWRLSCVNAVLNARIDPIVAPGKISDHVHSISGAINIGTNSTYDTLQTASCTSCTIQADKSAYWTPLLYYQFANGSFVDVPKNGMTVYYLGRGTDRANLVPFPKGFRSLAGNKFARHFDTTTTTYTGARKLAEAVSFACLDTAPSKEQNYMWRTQCVNGLRAQIHFPSCWDGVNVDSPDHQSHTAYLSGIDNGVCPPTHPKPFVHMFFEVLYSVSKINQEAGGRFVFSTGDTTGYGFHGDFLNGWDETVLAAAVASCANTVGGKVGDCAPFTPSNKVSMSNKFCPQQPPFNGEKVLGLLPKLPGCIKITPGPADATPADMSC